MYFGYFSEICEICSILAYPFKPHPLKNVQNHDMVPLQEVKWNMMSREVRAEYLLKKFWIPGAFEKWQKETEQEMIDEYRDSAKYKRFKRFMKKNR